MDDFSTPDQENVYGLAPSAPNFIRPGKKPLSSMSPTLLQDSQGRLVGAVGASGGPRIVTAVLQTLIRCAWPPVFPPCWYDAHMRMLQCCERLTPGRLS